MSFGMIPLSPDDKPDGFVLLSMYEKLESENAKLRELVRDYDKMLEVSLTGYDGPDVPLSDAVHISLRSRMYELGIEVDA